MIAPESDAEQVGKTRPPERGEHLLTVATLSKVAHLIVAWLVAIGSNFSALWILIANGWMQNPVGARFNPDTMRKEMTSFFDVVFNEISQAKFVHTVSAGYVTASVFVLGVSAWYLLKGRHTALARRSITVAASFGLASDLSVVVLGDESGYSASHTQRMKLAAMEGMWETHHAPAPFTLVGIPDVAARETHYAVEIPWVMGLIGTRSLTQEIPGINDLVAEAEDRIESGIKAYDALMTIREQRDATPAEVRETFEAHSDNLGFAFLLLRYMDDPRDATPEQIATTAEDTIPGVLPRGDRQRRAYDVPLQPAIVDRPEILADRLGQLVLAHDALHHAGLHGDLHAADPHVHGVGLQGALGQGDREGHHRPGPQLLKGT